MYVHACQPRLSMLAIACCVCLLASVCVSFRLVDSCLLFAFACTMLAFASVLLHVVSVRSCVCARVIVSVCLIYNFVVCFSDALEVDCISCFVLNVCVCSHIFDCGWPYLNVNHHKHFTRTI